MIVGIICNLYFLCNEMIYRLSREEKKSPLGSTEKNEKDIKQFKTKKFLCILFETINSF